MTGVASPLHPAITMAMGNVARSYSRLRATAREVSMGGASVPMVYRRGTFLVFPVGPVMPRRVPPGEPGAGTASISYAGLIGDAVETSKDRCLCASDHSILAGTSEQTQDFAVFSA